METDRSALAAKTDEQALNNLIETQKSWILKVCSDVTHRYITDSDDEWSTALLAFHEAVQSYDESKGTFLAFASVVIRRRLLDDIRSQWRHKGEIHVLPGELEEEPDRSIDTAQAAREEITAAQAILKPYGFSFFDLAESSPKAEKTKAACCSAVIALLKDGELLEKMRKNKALPMKELEKASGVARKILDRHRRYIIAAAEILSGEYPVLAEYLGYIRKALKT
ncbi:MAG: RNA polymerase subunit sigma [Firmicutes bacterium]|nr:RNA polymerase subunit sigma [Bacillota bacterium]MBR4143130.1 RNA polymerase subunit sigma [Bacillota bacterium]MBR6969995.1 RNA polymerase subunit sigma [Bacillota bacterium]